ncbi:MAG: ribosome-associated translation inhibitor RaiA [Anaerolineales bacterium]
MEIQVKGHNLEVGDTLRSYVERKVSKLDRFLPQLGEVQVDLSVENSRRAVQRQVAQITVRNGSGIILRAEERSGDMRQSIDAAIDKMINQIRRFKGKYWESRREGSVEPVFVEEPEEEEEESRIVRIKRFETRPMDAEEAIEQMELLGHDFFLFYNMATSSYSVVYKRRDGGYGLLLPEVV